MKLTGKIEKSVRDVLLQSGIYLISQDNGTEIKYYIGSGRCILNRLYIHRSKLERKTHFNSFLQNAYNKYGSDSFSFHILSIIEKDINTIDRELEILEQFYIDKYLEWGFKLFNIHLITDRKLLNKTTIVSQVDRNKRSLKRKEFVKEGYGREIILKAHKASMEAISYPTDKLINLETGHIVESFPSRKALARHMNWPATAANNLFRGITKEYRGYTIINSRVSIEEFK